MAAGVNKPDGKRIGTTTIGASGTAGTGAGLGVAIAAIVVYCFNLSGVDLGPIEWAIAAVTAAVLSFGSGLVGGKFTPSNQKDKPWSNAPTDAVMPTLPEEVADGTGRRRATDQPVVNEDA